MELSEFPIAHICLALYLLFLNSLKEIDNFRIKHFLARFNKMVKHPLFVFK